MLCLSSTCNPIYSPMLNYCWTNSVNSPSPAFLTRTTMNHSSVRIFSELWWLTDNVWSWFFRWQCLSSQGHSGRGGTGSTHQYRVMNKDTLFLLSGQRKHSPGTDWFYTILLTDSDLFCTPLGQTLGSVQPGLMKVPYAANGIIKVLQLTILKCSTWQLKSSWAKNAVLLL